METNILYCPNCKQKVLTKREDINLFLAFILVILTSGIGLLIYLIIYYEREPSYCVHCGAKCLPLNSGEMSAAPTTSVAGNGQTYHFLVYENPAPVANMAEEDTKYCYNCGETLDRKHMKYCALCGTNLDE